MANKLVLIIGGIIVAAILGFVIYALFVPSPFGCTDAFPNECNGQCSATCEDNRIFVCDNVTGGTCVINSSNCPAATPNSCDEQCFGKCGANQIFKCESTGGVCTADPNNCPAATPNSCNDTCWGACATTQKFVCNITTGGTCQTK